MRKTAIFLACLMLMTAACATTDDPGKGGLFSYSPDAYEKRKAGREARLAELRREQQAEEAQQGKLQASATSKRKTHASWSGQMKKINGDCSALRTQLNRYQARNEAQQAALKELRQKQAALQGQVDEAQTSSMTEEQKAAEAERLRREIEKLTDDFNSLSLL
ncbi:MAG: hypothetical protein LBQ51_10165 [Desulfovibrio sp.]|jgi:chromosome segregation ATPase|nr:hypothetical protein [Desulfovibrio sp.]